MRFTVHPVKDKGDVVEVRYDCECGCKPRARYQRGSKEAGLEHCCCGKVHFVGDRAAQQLEKYLEQRRAAGQDARHYALSQHRVSAPWGQVPVAFGVPDRLTEH